jgi:hypothetical protein
MDKSADKSVLRALVVGLAFFTACAGPAGPPGPAGAGEMGAVGTTGATGAMGVMGVMGTMGTIGPATGVMGAMGIPGAAGPAGPAGQTGATGASGSAGARELVARALPFRGSILDIECDTAAGSTRGTGTKTTNGLIVTAFHVVNGCTASAFVAEGGVQVGGGGSFFQPVAGRDLAIIQGITWSPAGAALAGVPALEGVHPSIGDPTLLVSYPGAITNDLQFTVATVADDDVVSSLEPALRTFWSSAFSADVSTEHGSSGGPVFNQAGQWVGILVGGLLFPPSSEAFLKVVIPIRFR